MTGDPKIIRKKSNCHVRLDYSNRTMIQSSVACQKPVLAMETLSGICLHACCFPSELSVSFTRVDTSSELFDATFMTP